MKRGIRVKEGEDLSKEKIAKVIELLEQEKPITKKDACSFLNITYNTTRLNKIIEDYKEQVEYFTKRKQEMKKAPLTKEDEAYIVSSYLEEGNLSLIAESTFRSTSVIKRVLDKYNIPLRTATNTYHNPPLLSVDSINENYKKDDLVYSARYGQPAYISEVLPSNIYRIWLIGDEQYAYQPYYELGDLRKVQVDLNLSINTRKFWEDTEMQQMIADAINKAKKEKKK